MVFRNGIRRDQHIGASAIALAAAAFLSLATTGISSARADEQQAPTAAQVAQAAPAQAPAQAPAASSSSDNSQLEEVTVTARYRTENVQTTPIAITALTGDQLESRGITSVIDAANQAPNVEIQPSAAIYGKAAQAFIRGVGQFDFDYALSPGVGFYIDDVYYDFVAGTELDLLDLDHIEVLRGPQGTLFGKNTEGGAIRIFSNKPKGDNSGYVEAGYGSYNRLRFRGAFDVSAIPDKVFIRVSGGSDTDDGYQKLIDFACAHPNEAGTLKPSTTASSGCQIGTLGSTDVQDGRIAIRALPADGLEINVEADVLNDHGSSPANTELLLNYNLDGTGLGHGTAGNPYAGSNLYEYNHNYLLPAYGFQLNSSDIPASPYYTYARFSDPLTGYSVQPISTTFQYGFGGTIDWDAIPDTLHVRSITAYRAFNGYQGYVNDATAFPLIFGDNIVSHRQVSQETDFSGNLDLFGNKLEWTAGAFYLTSDNGEGGFNDFSEGISFFPSPAPAGGVTLPNGVHYAGGALIPAGSVEPYAYNVNDDAHDDTEAGFLHWVYHITDDVSFEGGYRYSVENRSYTFNHTYTYQTVPEAPLVPPGYLGKFSFPRSDAKAAFQWQITPQIMTYASVSTGFKAGGINPRPYAAQQVYSFKPEDLTAYEVGIKSDLLDHHLRVNFDGFLSNFKNLQELIFIFTNYSPGFCLCYENAGHVLIEGLEGEVEATPLPGLLLNASAGYLQWNTMSLGTLNGVSVQSLTAGSSATPWPTDVPKWKVNLGGQYTYDSGDYGSLTGRLDWAYQSRVFFDTLDTAQLAQNGYGILNSHLTWTSPDSTWQSVLEVTNISGQVYYLNKFGVYSGGDWNAQPGKPREFLFTMRRTFGASAEPAAYVPPPAPPPAAAPAPPPAAAAPEAQREFQVFFDFDKSNITDAAAKVIQAAADVVKSGGVAHITVTGHTDTVGTAAYNQGLSERRAAAVKTALVSDGVGGGEIGTLGVGKNGLLVPTADGVREPQNRRAVIQLQ